MDVLNAFGQFLLPWLNYRWVAVYTIIITAILLIVSGAIHRKMPSSPPALKFLSEDSAGRFRRHCRGRSRLWRHHHDLAAHEALICRPNPRH